MNETRDTEFFLSFVLSLGKIVCLSAQIVQKRNARKRKVLKLLLQHPVLN